MQILHELPPTDFIARKELSSVIECLSSKGPLVTFIIGMTGIGKTTLAAYVAKTAIKNGMFDNTFLVHQPEDSNEIRNAIAIASEGKSLVCLDGLDEWSAKLQAELSEIISSFFHTPEGHIIITSRSIPRWGDWSRQTHIIELGDIVNSCV